MYAAAVRMGHPPRPRPRQGRACGPRAWARGAMVGALEDVADRGIFTLYSEPRHRKPSRLPATYLRPPAVRAGRARACA